jgi:acetoin utilization deacetylase AcuC-like enzyme
MEIIYHPSFMQHDTGEHPENPNRLRVFMPLGTADFESGKPLLNLVHIPAYIDKVSRIAQNEPGWIDSDTFVSAGSFEAACMATGAAIHASATNGFALVRPPGHHAYPGRGTGFCLFNNIAIAVKNLVNKKQRVLIFDFDGHCGDGTSEIFYETEDVLIWTIHQYPAFPGKGWVDEIGSGKGKGFTLHVPMPPQSGDDIYEHAINTFFPVAEQFDPDVVAFSAGFDAHYSDPLLNLQVTNRTFYEIGKKFKGRFSDCFAVLEGGYNLQTLKGSALSFIRGINGEDHGFPETASTSNKTVWDEYLSREEKIKKIMKVYWQIP